jgi:hypothetical protein
MVADLPPSPSKVTTFAETSRFLMLANRNEEAIAIGRESFALARELGLREPQAHALTNLGTARVNSGDFGGFDDLREAVSVAEEISSAEMLRALGNEASLRAGLGELGHARMLFEQTVDRAAKLGVSGFTLWCEAEFAQLDYLRGAWDDALAAADGFLAKVPEYYVGVMARTVRAEILVARGEAGAGLAEADRALAFARGAKDPQVLYPTLAAHARLLALVGRAQEAHERCDELLALARARTFEASQWVLHLTLALDELRRMEDAAALVAGLTISTGWRDASGAYVRGDLTAAADVLAALGDLADEAYVRLRAAERGEPAPQLDRALAFYRGVGASGYVRRGEALLPATA